MFEKVIINGINIDMEIDTVTYTTVISEKCYTEKFKNFKIVKTERN